MEEIISGVYTDLEWRIDLLRYHDLTIRMLRAQFEYTTLSCTMSVPAGNAMMSGSPAPDWMRSSTL